LPEVFCWMGFPILETLYNKDGKVACVLTHHHRLTPLLHLFFEISCVSGFLEWLVDHIGLFVSPTYGRYSGIGRSTVQTRFEC
jgi:hypothetical protein